ncbi:hypothetical protein BDF21DRAFT_415150 [Thamnidium elegans]|nr:hypothetical protein BDF21DRAFT_415150 [Thamnidium elegans]
MDRMYPERPLVTWLHRMRDGPPTDIIIDQLLDDKWRITAFSKHTQRFTMISLHYINKPAKNCKPIIKILELFNFTLPVIKFEEIFNYKSRINLVGCSIRILSQTEHDTTQGNLVLSIYRSFEDGSIRVNYIELGSDQHTTFTGHPTYTVVSQSESFDQLMSNLGLELLPERKPRSHSSETVDIAVSTFREYLEHIEPGSLSLKDEFKRKIAEKVQHLKSTCTFRDLFENEEYRDYKLQDLNDFLDQMEVHEEIERARQVDTFGIYHHGQPTDMQLHRKLKQAHEKEIHLSSVMIRPLRDDTTKFRYLDTATYNFPSTITSKLFSDLWSVNDTRYDQLEFPTYSPNKLLQPEQFPSVNIYNKLGSPEPFLSQQQQSMPEIPMSVPVLSTTTTKKRKKEEEQPQHDFSNISTQPLPGVFGSRIKKPTKKPVKKKSKTSGFK